MELFQKDSGVVKMIGLETDEELFEAALHVVRTEQAHVATETSGNMWNARMGHCGDEVLWKSFPYICGIEDEDDGPADDCDSCNRAKAVRSPRKLLEFEDRVASNPLERAFSDALGPMKDRSIGNSRFFVTMLDECSGHLFVRFVARKIEVADAAMAMTQELEKLFNNQVRKLMTINHNSVKGLRTDGGGEHTEDKFLAWIRHIGIAHEVTTAYSSQSNGAAERLNRTLLDMARTMLLRSSHTRCHMWAEDINTVRFLCNCLLTRSCRKKMTPYEANHGERPNFGHIQIFGRRVYIYKLEHKRSRKFDTRAVTRTLVDFSRGNAYRVLLDDGNVIIDNQNVKIIEKTRPGMDVRR